MIPLAHLQRLPCFHRITITAEHLDVMGHMNVRHYMGIFDDGSWSFFAAFGMDQTYYSSGTGGGFALKQVISYLAEVRMGETVAIHSRVIGRSAKRIHGMHFMVNETTSQLAATLEFLGSHANLQTRRTSPYPPRIAAHIDQMLAEHQQLPWQAPLSGVIQA